MLFFSAFLPKIINAKIQACTKFSKTSKACTKLPQRVRKNKSLGVIIDEKLDWKEQVDAISKKVS